MFRHTAAALEGIDAESITGHVDYRPATPKYVSSMTYLRERTTTVRTAEYIEAAQKATAIEALWAIAEESQSLSRDDFVGTPALDDVRDVLLLRLEHDLEAEENEKEKDAKTSAWNEFVRLAEAAMESFGKIIRVKQAQTGTLYYTVEREDACGCSREVVVRVANHGDCYCRADVSVVHGSPTPDDIGVEELASWLSKIEVECDDSHEE